VSGKFEGLKLVYGFLLCCKAKESFWIAMSTPRTSSGRICKKCLKKGSPCHLHTSVASGVASQKSPSKKKQREIFADQFENLALPALERILLNLDRSQLHATCISSRQASKVCREPRFQRLYNAKHPSLIVGNLHLNDKSSKILTIGKGSGRNQKTATFQDEIGNKIEIQRIGPFGDAGSQYFLNFLSTNDEFRLSLVYGYKSDLYFDLWTYNRGEEFRESIHMKVLTSIGKPDWLESVREIQPNFKHVKEFYVIFQTNIRKAKGGKKIWKEIIDRPPRESDYKEWFRKK